MQTPKQRSSSLDVPQRKSPTGRQPRTTGTDPDSVPSPNSANKMPKNGSPKFHERRSSRSPVAEKKRGDKVLELETQLSQLQEDLKAAKDQVNLSESLKRQAQQDAEDANRQLSATLAKLEESEHQLSELSASDDVRVQELRKVSQDRDREWQSELEAVKKQHSVDSAAMISAMNEIKKLKSQLEMVAKSEAAQTNHAESAHGELIGLRIELKKALSEVNDLKTELGDSRQSEADALEHLRKTQETLETANATVEVLQSDSTTTTEIYSSLAVQLEQSKAQVRCLEELVSKLQEVKQNEETEKLKLEIESLEVEGGRLRYALEAAESRYHEEYVKSTLQIRSAYEQAEVTKLEASRSCIESAVDLELEKLKSHIEELRQNLMDKETQLQSISEENSMLNLKIEKCQSNQREPKLVMELTKLESYVAELRTNLLDKETRLRDVNEENEMLKMEIQKKDMDQNMVNNEAVAMAEVARCAEREALMQIENLTNEAEKSSRRVERATEQLDACQAANAELEGEMRRLKVQSDQWRKAAEAAASMLSTGNNGKLVERTGSLDSKYNTIGASLGSPFSEDMDDDDRSLKKKNGNVLRRIGVLWKKGQK